MAVNFSGSLVATGSIISTTGFTGSLSGTASYASDANLLDGKDSSTFATTGSNVFVGNQTITGSFAVSGSTTQVGNNTLLGNTTLSGSIIISGSVGAKADINLGGVLRLDPATDPGSTNLTASFLFTSASNTATGFDLYYRQKDNLVKFKWLEGGLSTGLLYGGVITYSGSTIFVSKGSGIINNLNASTGSEIAPIFNYVAWNDFTGSATYLTASQNTFIYVDNTGVVRQQPEYFNPDQFREALPLGRVTHANYTAITGAGSNVQTTYDSDAQQNEFIRIFGPIKESGLLLSAQTGSMSLSIGAGQAYNFGGFYPQDPNHPSHYISSGFPTASIARAYRSGSAIRLDNNNGAFYTTVDSTKWDDGTGVLNSMSSGDWQIQRVFVNPVTGRTVVYYGQAVYSTLLNALQYLPTDPFEEGEFTAKSLVFVGYLVIKGNTTNLADTGDNSIIQSGIFRGTQGSSGGSIISTTLDSLSDVVISTPSNGQALIYNSGIWANGNPASSSYALTASFVAGITNETASYANTASFAITASYLLGQSPTASYALTASYVENAQTASYVLNAISSSYAATASSADNFLVRGTLTAQTINVQTITSSIEFNTGSTRNGSTTSNTHEFTGSVGITGSLGVSGSLSVVGANATINRINIGRGNGSGTSNIAIGSSVISSTLSSGDFNIAIGNSALSNLSSGTTNVALGLTALTNLTSGELNIGVGRDAGAGIQFGNRNTFIGHQAGGGITSNGSFNTVVGNYIGSGALNRYVVLADGSGSVRFIYDGVKTSLPNNVEVTGSVISTTGFTGSLQGTATTASFVQTAQTASYVLQAISSSFATNALSASYWSGSIINATSASFALTASYISGSGGGVGFPFSGSAVITGSLLVSQSFVDFTQATYVTGSFTGSFNGTATSASFALNANTASFAHTASFALIAGNAPGTTATFTQSIAATTWSFTHNLNTRNPLLQVYDSTNSQVIPFNIVGEDPTTALIYFDTAESGFAVASNGGGLTVSGSTARLNQTVAATTWSFQHNLGTRYPNFIIYGSNDEVVIPAGIKVIDNFNAEVYFSVASTGTAIANFSGINGAPNATTASYAETASFGTNFIVGNTLTIDQTLTDYHTVASSIAGSNNMFNQNTGSYSSGFFKYTVANGANARSGEIMAVWTGGAIQFTDNSTLDIGNTSGVVASVVIASNAVQFNLTTATSGWRLKSLATFM